MASRSACQSGRPALQCACGASGSGERIRYSVLGGVRPWCLCYACGIDLSPTSATPELQGYSQSGELGISGPTCSHWAIQGGAAPSSNLDHSFAILVRVPVVAIASGALTLRPRTEHLADKLHATQCGDATYEVPRYLRTGLWQAVAILNAGETDTMA